MLEIDAFDALRDIVERDYETFSGKMLERYFKDKLIEEKRYTQIDNWWSRNGEDEIDLIAINELTKIAAFCEIKRNEKELDLPLLAQRTHSFLVATRELKKYTITSAGLSMRDM